MTCLLHEKIQFTNRGCVPRFQEIEEDIADIPDPVELYVPLERPNVPSINLCQPQLNSDNEDNISDESSSDSDSAIGKSSKRRNPRSAHLNPKSSSVAQAKRKNYNIWCTEIQTEVLTKNLTECNVDQSIDRTRDVETYDYRSAFLNDSDESRHSFTENKNSKKSGSTAKRRHDGNYVDGNKPGFKLKGNSRNKLREEIGSARKILSLSTTVNDSEADIARDICNKLHEEKQDLILKALTIVGKEQCIALFEETRKVEKNGGMLIMNNTRRRTPGGVFLHLLKSSKTISREKLNLVFDEDRRMVASERKKTAKEKKKERSAKLKEQLSKDDFTTVLTQTREVILRARNKMAESAEVKNPPPSPATDGRENSSDGEEQKFSDNSSSREPSEGRNAVSYGDDLFGGGEDEMEVA